MYSRSINVLAPLFLVALLGTPAISDDCDYPDKCEVPITDLLNPSHDCYIGQALQNQCDAEEKYETLMNLLDQFMCECAQGRFPDLEIDCDRPLADQIPPGDLPTRDYVRDSICDIWQGYDPDAINEQACENDPGDFDFSGIIASADALMNSIYGTGMTAAEVTTLVECIDDNNTNSPWPDCVSVTGQTSTGCHPFGDDINLDCDLDGDNEITPNDAEIFVSLSEEVACENGGGGCAEGGTPHDDAEKLWQIGVFAQRLQACGGSDDFDICELLEEAATDIIGHPPSHDDWQTMSDGAGDDLCGVSTLPQDIPVASIQTPNGSPTYEGEFAPIVILPPGDCGSKETEAPGGGGGGCDTPNGTVATHGGASAPACFTEPGGFPIDLTDGAKLEPATDLTVVLPGKDFSLHRVYRSDLTSTSGMFGQNWMTADHVFLAINGSDLVVYSAGAQYDYRSSSGQWIPDGASEDYIEESTLEYMGSTVDVYVFIRPGEGSLTFMKDGLDPIYDGLLLQREDIYGNRWTYSYFPFGTDGSGDPVVAVPSRIRFEARTDIRTSSPTYAHIADVTFNWHYDESNILNGRIKRANVHRFSADTPVLTQYVEYTYFDDTTHDDNVGTDGDLVQVAKYTRVDDAEGSLEPFRLQITQYRYHRDADTEGDDHDLKMVIMPQQIEYHLQQTRTSTSSLDDLITTASDLLEETDDASLGSYDLDELAAKIVEYDSSHRVETQYIQSGCGCSGAAQALRREYEYLPQTGSYTSTTKILEYLWNGSSWDADPYRVLYYDFDDVTGSGVPYIRHVAIADAELHSTSGDGLPPKN